MENFLMRKALCTSLFLFSTLWSQASEQFPFIGASLSTQTIGYTDDDTRITGFSLHYGKQSQEWRTLFGADYHTDSYSSLFVEVDRILLDDMFGTPKLRPYLGVSAGYMHMHTLDDAVARTGMEEDDLESNGFYFGGNFGFLIYANDRVDVDLGYHYFSVQNLDYLDDIHGATLSVHYFY